MRACLLHLGSGAAAAVVFNDETVCDGPPPPDLGNRFWLWQEMCAASGVHLVDWFACDDQLYRSSKLALRPDDEWWDVPS